MSRYIQIDNSDQRPVFYSVQTGRLKLDRYAVMLMWAKYIDAGEADNLYYRTLTEYWYRYEKEMEPPGPGSLNDYYDQLDRYCYYDLTEIQNAVNFIENKILPSLDIYCRQHDALEPLVNEWGGVEAFENYFDKNCGVFTLLPDFYEGELEDNASSMAMVFRELKDVFQDSLDSGEPYGIYVH